MIEVGSLDDLFKHLSKQVDPTSGENLFAQEQTKLLEKDFQNKRTQLLQNQLIMQAVMDVKKKLPPKVYAQIIQRIA